MGDVGIEEELDLKGIQYLGGPSDGDHKVELKAGYAMPHDPEVTHHSHFCIEPCFWKERLDAIPYDPVLSLSALRHASGKTGWIYHAL